MKVYVYWCMYGESKMIFVKILMIWWICKLVIIKFVLIGFFFKFL